MKNNIQGLGIALVTPFQASGEVDYAALERLVGYVTQGGADYLVALGTTAETPTLSSEEKRQILSCIKRANTASLPLVVGIGGNSTAEVARSFSKYDLSGVDAILSVTPYYNKPTQEGLFQHYRALGIESPLPILLYNVPGRTGVNMTAQTTLRLSRERNIMGIKEACGSLSQMSYILRDRPAGFKVISGDDALTLPLAALGGDGIISVAGNAFPAQMAAMARAEAATHLKMQELIDMLFEEGNPAGIKTALDIKGLCGNLVRLPLMPTTEALRNRIKEQIEKYGF